MATLIPSRNLCLPRMTGGERRTALRLEEQLDDDYLAWYDVPIGPRQRQPDFVVLHPNRGLLVLEVKDWKLDTVVAIDKSRVTLRTERGDVTVVNPLLQARAYALELNTALQRDPALAFPPGHRLQGKSQVTWGHGVVLANVSRAQFEAHELCDVLPEHLVLLRDDLQESVDRELFEQRLWGMFSVQASHVLTLPQIDRIRWHLFPEIRVVSPMQPDLWADDQSQVDASSLQQALPDLVRVMDLQQEQLARSLGDGHRVIHGVAGSGKTMILGYRCLHLARSTQRPILVLCYNVTLAARLEQLIAARGLQSRVNVRNFHAWCNDMLRTYHVPKPPDNRDKGAFFDAMVDAVIAGVEGNAIPRGQYGAVLIDEGHDFEPHWLQLITQMVDPSTNSLLVLYDDAQAIYGGAKRKRFSFKSVGIQAQGRTTVLRLNYRNTYEILAMAKAFAGDLLDGSEGDDDTPHVIAPESAGRHGPSPQVIDCQSLQHVADVISSKIADLIANGHDPNQIAVIWRDYANAAAIEKALRRKGVPLRTATSSRDKKALFHGQPSVKLVSMHSSKGLEFETVFVSGLGRQAKADDDAVTEARLLYVAMTRAMTSLTVVRLTLDVNDIAL